MTHSPDAPLQFTALHATHQRLGAQLVPFGGWDMPLQYTSQIKEHLSTRNEVGIFDVSHMGQIMITGPAAGALADALVTRAVADLPVGEVAYALLCNGDGGLRDDLMVSRLSAERFLLVVNASTYADDVAYMQAIAEQLRLDAQFTPCAERYAMIAIQGPQWQATAALALRLSMDDLSLPPMRTRTFLRAGTELIYSTTGYTGEPGIEVLCPPEQAESIWKKLLTHGAVPVGLAARDSLRMEKGMPLSGQDFTTANNPFEAGLGWAVNLDKAGFPGLAALREIHAARAQGAGRKFVGLRPQGKRIARHGAKILKDGQVIGEVTSGGFSPVLEAPIGLGYIDAPFAAAGTVVELDLGRGTIEALVGSRRHVK